MAETETETGIFQKTGETADKLTNGLVRLIGSVAPKVQKVTGNGLKKVAEGANSAAQNLEVTPESMRRKAQKLREKADLLEDRAEALDAVLREKAKNDYEGEE